MGSVHVVFRTAEIWEDLRKFKPFFYLFIFLHDFVKRTYLYSLRTSQSSFPPVAKDNQLRRSIPIWDTKIVRGQVIGPERSTMVGQQWGAIEEVTQAGPAQFVYIAAARPWLCLGSYQHSDPLLFAQHGHSSQNDTQQHPECRMCSLLITCQLRKMTNMKVVQHIY